MSVQTMTADSSFLLRSAPTSAPADERFWSHVDTDGDCWPYVGSRDPQGYGKLLRKDLGPLLAHRYAWMLVNGAIPDGLRVLHLCDNPPCVRPSHLVLGTQAANIADRDLKGHHRPGRFLGEAHPAHRLSDEDVVEIRRAARLGVSYRELATQFGVHRVTISTAARGQNWSHLAEPVADKRPRGRRPKAKAA